jgi:6-phosphogluconolactonase (cycloisomerase 2 family)
VSEFLVGAYGTDMDGSAPGIVKLRSKADGSLERVDGFLIEAISPAFLARGGDGTLYAALEGENAVFEVGGARWPSGGVWPCHIGVYGDDVVVANYFNGTLGTRRGQVVEPLAGRGPHAAQDGPHAHSTAEIAAGVILSADLGADRVVIHSLVDGVLTQTGSVALPPATGPRDLLVAGDLLYILGEHRRVIITAVWRDGTLTLLDEIGLPGAADSDQAAALVLANGFLYALLRGSNQISVLRVSGDGLEAVGSVSSGGDWPRHAVADSGFLHVANQRSGTVTSFALGDDGMPVAVGEPCHTPSPTYLLLD